MADIWRIFVIEGEENLNRTITNALRKDGYGVQGVINGADAIRGLWSEEYNVVICDLNTPGVDGFELLQWLRWYRPNVHVILVGEPDTATIRLQALESGATSYLEKPLDLRLLREELRRFLQWTGFSASLDSFDLLDVIQIITMSRRSIALLVNTGLEEHGVLRFQGGELVWAEYGTLLGEEAFFALAAHKNGTVIHQPWSGQSVSNVTQPLSRLIFQALQYRTKYANMQQASGELNAISTLQPQPDSDRRPLLSTLGEIDDSPFTVLTEYQGLQTSQMQNEPVKGPTKQDPSLFPTRDAKEWWEKTGSVPVLNLDNGSGGLRPSRIDADPTVVFEGPILTGGTGNMGDAIPSAVIPSATQKPLTDLPSWLTEQPTSPEMAALRRSSLSDSVHIPATPAVGSAPTPWQMPHSTVTTGDIASNQALPLPLSMSPDIRQATYTGQQSPAAESAGQSQLFGELQDLSSMMASSDVISSNGTQQRPTGPYQRMEKRSYNYSALVAALQTLGYSIVGFIAAAIVNMEGQPIAQVAVDDLDISHLCKLFSAVLKNMLSALEQSAWGTYEDTVITSADCRILIKLVDSEKKAFQILMTTRDANPVESLRFMASVSGTMSAALYEPGEKIV